MQAYNARAAEEQALASGPARKGDRDRSDRSDRDHREAGLHKAHDGQKAEKDKENKEKDKEGKEGKEKEGAPKAGNGSGGDGVDEGVLPPPLYRRRRHHAADAAALARDNNIELVNIMLEALEREHEVGLAYGIWLSLFVSIALYLVALLTQRWCCDWEEGCMLQLACPS